MSMRCSMALVLVAGLALSACGGSSTSSSPSGGGATSGGGSAAGSGSASGAAPAQAPSEQQSAATGDIPDNQVFLTFRGLGVSLRYPEGWTQQRSAAGVSFTDKANAVTLKLSRGARPTAAGVRAELSRANGLTIVRVSVLQRPAGSTVKASYRVRGRADPVTGKRPTLLVDRYVYAHRGHVATLDLATPKGVDNVDAYRLISESFRWR